MERPLHNKIFGSTSCLSEEQLLKYGSHALSKKEKHIVEKHLIECELCSDALEGISVVALPSGMEDARNQVRQIAIRGNGASTVNWKRLLLAASIIGIAFLSFIFVFQKNKMAERKMLSENVNTETNNSIPESADQGDVITKTNGNTENKIPSPDEVNAITGEERKKMKTGQTASKFIEGDKLSREVSADKLTKGKDEFSTSLALKEDIVKEAMTLAVGETLSESAETDILSVPVEKSMADLGNTLKEEDKYIQTSNQALAIAGEKKAEEEVVAGSYCDETKNKNHEAESKPVPEKKAKVQTSASGVKYIKEYKVLDNSKTGAETIAPEINNIPAQYENTEVAKKAEAEASAKTKLVPYDRVLKEGLDFINSGKNREALEKFSLILSNDPADLNANFYAGLAYFNLGDYDKALLSFDAVTSSGNTAFYDEGTWYKALTYLKKNENEKARVLLMDISQRENFYKTRAAGMLEDMEKK